MKTTKTPTKTKTTTTRIKSTPSLGTIAKRSLTTEASLRKGSTLIVAVSGGPDSMALLSVLARLGPAFGLTIVAHGVDHGLRAEARSELDLAESFAKSLGIPFTRTLIAVPRGGNLQERARMLRWAALVEDARERNVNRDDDSSGVLRKSAAIATAHHADDRAETILMRLLRGAGMRGLAVLPAKASAPGASDVPVVRPLLRARRSDILRHLARHGVPFALDPSNEDPRYLRTQMRRRVLPLLEELDPEIVRHLEAVADELLLVRSDADAHEVTKEHERGGDVTAPRWATSLPRSTQVAIATLVRSRSPKARVWLPDGLVLSVATQEHGRRISKHSSRLTTDRVTAKKDSR